MERMGQLSVDWLTWFTSNLLLFSPAYGHKVELSLFNGHFFVSCLVPFGPLRTYYGLVIKVDHYWYFLLCNLLDILWNFYAKNRPMIESSPYTCRKSTSSSCFKSLWIWNLVDTHLTWECAKTAIIFSEIN